MLMYFPIKTFTDGYIVCAAYVAYIADVFLQPVHIHESLFSNFVNTTDFFKRLLGKGPGTLSANHLHSVCNFNLY